MYSLAAGGGGGWNVGECCVNQWTCVVGICVGCYANGVCGCQAGLNTATEGMGAVK